MFVLNRLNRLFFEAAYIQPMTPERKFLFPNILQDQVIIEQKFVSLLNNCNFFLFPGYMVAR